MSDNLIDRGRAAHLLEQIAGSLRYGTPDHRQWALEGVEMLARELTIDVALIEKSHTEDSHGENYVRQ